MTFPFLASRDIFQAVFETLPLGICVTDAGGFFVFVNKNYCRIYGYTEQELIGESFIKIVQPSQRQLLQNLHKDFIRGKEELDAEWTVLGKNGKSISISAKASRFKGNDGQYYILTMVEELTHKNFLKRQKALSERVLFQDISKPLKEIETDIINFSTRKVLPPRVLEYCDSMRDSVDRIHTQLTCVRDLSLITSGNFVPARNFINLNDLFNKLKNEFFYLAKSYRVETEFYINVKERHHGANLVIILDYFLLRATLENLIKNAIEASPEGDLIYVSGIQNGDRLEIKVRNKGEVPASILKSFFSPYVTTKSFGTGLGTYSAKLLTEAIGGVLSVRSENGETELLISLPIGVVVGNI